MIWAATLRKLRAYVRTNARTDSSLGKLLEGDRICRNLPEGSNKAAESSVLRGGEQRLVTPISTSAAVTCQLLSADRAPPLMDDPAAVRLMEWNSGGRQPNLPTPTSRSGCIVGRHSSKSNAASSCHVTRLSLPELIALHIYKVLRFKRLAGGTKEAAAACSLRGVRVESKEKFRTSPIRWRLTKDSKMCTVSFWLCKVLI